MKPKSERKKKHKSINQVGPSDQTAADILPTTVNFAASSINSSSGTVLPKIIDIPKNERIPFGHSHVVKINDPDQRDIILGKLSECSSLPSSSDLVETKQLDRLPIPLPVSLSRESW
jgi:hypothetical protein